jgi:hypothetical protein
VWQHRRGQGARGTDSGPRPSEVGDAERTLRQSKVG